MPECRKCQWWKRKATQSGLCWLYREDYPMGMPVKESDSCDNHVVKVVMVRRSDDAAKPTV